MMKSQAAERLESTVATSTYDNECYDELNLHAYATYTKLNASKQCASHLCSSYPLQFAARSGIQVEKNFSCDGLNFVAESAIRRLIFPVQ